jgi:hypothetical protein
MRVRAQLVPSTAVAAVDVPEPARQQESSRKAIASRREEQLVKGARSGTEQRGRRRGSGRPGVAVPRVAWPASSSTPAGDLVFRGGAVEGRLEARRGGFGTGGGAGASLNGGEVEVDRQAVGMERRSWDPTRG